MKIKKFDEQFLWDAGNMKALKSYIDKDDNKLYQIKVNEPFEIKTKDSETYYKLKFILNSYKISFEDSITNL